MSAEKPRLVWHNSEWKFVSASPCCGEPVVVPLRFVAYRRQYGPALLELKCGLAITANGLPDRWTIAAPGCHIMRAYDLTAPEWAIPEVLPDEPPPDWPPPGSNIRRR